MSDTQIEDVLRKPVTPLWDEMKRDARLPFEDKNSDGFKAISSFANTLEGTGIKLHLAGHIPVPLAGPSPRCAGPSQKA